MKKCILITTLALFTLLLVSCPEPLTEEVVVQSQDSIAPTIEIYSPSGNEAFYSVVEFQGAAMDDALEEGDEKGDVARIAFSVSNDDFRGGAIDISVSGEATQDSESGPDLITYDDDTGIFEFSFSTIEPNPLGGVVSVTIEVTDRNNNIAEYKVSLSENEGPWFEMELVDENGLDKKYLAGKNLFLSGTVGNSEDVQTEADEIVRITWTIAGSITGTLDMREGATYTNDYTPFDTLSYYNSSTGLYERKVSGYLSEVLAGTFSYDPSDRSFDATIFMNYNLDNLGSVFMDFEVEDQSGHITERSYIISENKIGPNINFNLLSDASLGHFSANTEADISTRADLITGSCGENITSLLEFKIQLKNGDHISSEYSHDDGTGVIPASADKNFVVDIRSFINDFANHIDYDSAVDTYVLFTAVGSNGVESFITLPVVEDSDAPVISSYSFISDHSNNNYANSNSTLDMTLNINEVEEMESSNELELVIEIGDYTSATMSINEGLKDDISVTGSTWSSTLTTEGNIPVSITLRDRLGNENIYTNASVEVDDEIMHYPGTGGLSTDWSSIIEIDMFSNSNGIADDEEDNWAAKSETVNLNIASVGGARVLESVSNLYINSVAQGSPGFSNTYSQSTDDVAADDLEVSFLVVDKAGNQYSVSDSGLVTYDSRPPSNVSLTPYLDGSELGTFYVSTVQDDSEVLSLPVMDNTTLMDDNFDHLTYNNLDVTDNNVTANSVNFGTLSTETDGSYTAQFVIYDKAGNSTSKNVNYTIERSAPFITVTKFESTNTAIDPAYVAYAGKSHDVLLDFTVTDGGSGLDMSSYIVEILDATGTTLFLDSQTASSDGANSDERSYTKDLSAAATGDNEAISFSITVSDVAGNTAVYKNNEEIDGRQYTATSVDFYSSTLESNMGVTFSANVTDVDNSRYWAKGTEEITLTATSPQRELHSSSAIFNSNSGDQSMTVKSGDDTSRVFKYDMTTAEPDGTLSFDLAFMDKAGNSWTVNNKNSDDDSYSVLYDDSAPIAGNASLALYGGDVTAGVSGDYLNMYVNGDETIRITDNSIDTYLKGFTYTISGPDSFSQTESTVQSGSDISIDDGTSDDVQSGNDGSYSVSVTFYDFAGNASTSTANYSFTKDESPPSVSDVTFTATGTNPDYVKAGHKAQLEFNISDGTVSDVSIKGNTASVVEYTPGSKDKGYELTIPDSSTGNQSEIAFSGNLTDSAGNETSFNNDNTTDTIMFYYGSPADSVTLSFGKAESNDNVIVVGGNYYAKKDADYALKYNSTIDLESLVGHFDSDSDSTENSPVKGTLTNFITSRQDTDSESEVTFTVTITDKADNTATVTSISGSQLFYDNLAPRVSGEVLGWDGSATGYKRTGTVGSYTYYINDNASNQVLSLPSTELNPYQYRYTLGGSYNSATIGTAISLSESDFSDGTYTINVKLVDKAGNESSAYDASLTFIVDRTAPTITADGVGSRDVLTVDTTDIGSPELTSVALIDGPPNDEGGIAGTTTYTINTLETFIDGTEYTFTAPSYSDAAGNASQTSFSIVYGTGSDLTVSGISSLDMTLLPDSVSDTDAIPTSYRSVRVYDYSYAAPETIEAGVQTESRDLNEIGRMKRRQISPSAPVSLSKGIASVNRNLPERTALNLDTTDQVVKQAMDQVIHNQAEYERQIQSLMTPKLSRARLEKMESLMEPEYIEPEVLTVSATPFLTGGAVDIQITAGTELVSDDKSSGMTLGAVIIQVLAALMMVLAAIGFVVVLKKMSKS
ncbi:MAG: Ig-like domain repeat protein [Spirochaetales bacterium]|nr:Ig-like domain repeat protein [Spirochaetales bacterium]